MTEDAGAPAPPVEVRTIVIGTETSGRRLDVAAAAALPDVSRTQLARLIDEGAVTLNGRTAAPSQKVKAGDVVVYAPPPPVAVALRAEEIPLSIVYEDEALLVLDKQAGLVVHPAPGHEDGTLVNALLAHCRDLRGIGGELRPGIVHRLDRDTSGLMVVAKDDATMSALGADFKVHRIERRYEALVIGQPPGEAGRLETLHGRDPHDRKKFTTRVTSGKRAVTDWRALELFDGAARMEAELHTGRTHQVRIHFASLGCPLLGDATYGRPPRDGRLKEIAAAIGRQALHAKRLGFHHPGTGAWLAFESKPPVDMERALTALRALQAPAAALRGLRGTKGGKRR